jgi:uncharacterized protein (DUF433 family)
MTCLPLRGTDGYDQRMETPATSSAVTSPVEVVPVIGEYISVKPGHCGGKAHIHGHRIKVQHVAIWHERMGMTAEEIAATYPTLSLPAIYAALAYYHAHRQEIDSDIEADERFVANLRAQAGSSMLQQKLAEIHAANDSLPPG